MVEILFKDFLESDEAFSACVEYWERSVRDLSASLQQSAEWERWALAQYADGVPFPEKWNPIFGGRSRRLNRAFRIIQHPPENDLVIGAWLYNYGEEWDADMPDSELFVSLSLSQESAVLAQALLCKWMSPDTYAQEMEVFIRQTLPSVNA